MDFELTTPQKELAERAYKVGRDMREAAVEWDRVDQAPWGFMRDTLRDAGLLGITMPVEYGGQGLTALDYVLAIEGVFRGAQTWVVPEPMFCSSGPGPSIMMLGTPEMREYYLPKVVTGELGVAISLSEPDHGSDLTDLETTAVRDGDDYIVTGRKAFISGAGVNELHATFVRFDGVPGHQGVGALVIEDPSPGLRTERGYEFVGDRGLPHGDVFLDEVRVPARNLLIGPGQFGRLMSAFNMERLHNATLCLGLAEAAFDEASDFVKNRKTFGRPVLEFQSVYHELADIWTEIEGHRLLVHRAATNARDGIHPRGMDVTLAKLSGSKMLPKVTMRCMEMHGGYGVTTDYAIQRLHRDAVTSVVAGGAPAVLRNTIAAQLFPGFDFSQKAGG